MRRPARDAAPGGAGTEMENAKNKKGPEGPFVSLEALPQPERIGAGDGIRTLDPNLGKVMLYP
jgi:hypothetical protein